MGDYQRDTGALSIAEHGAYFLMLQYHYATEKPLPTGRDLYRLLRCESKVDRDAVDAVTRQYWTETPAGLVNERAAQEIVKASDQADTNRRIAKAREDKRKAERNAHEALHEPCSDREPSHSHNQTPEPTKSKTNTKPPAKARAVSLPPDFGISDHVREWATDKGHTRLDERLSHFIGYVKANGKMYVDWDQAFMNAIRDDWAKLPPIKHNAPASKTASALISLEGMKNEPASIQHSHGERPAEIVGFIPPKHATG